MTDLLSGTSRNYAERQTRNTVPARKPYHPKIRENAEEGKSEIRTVALSLKRSALSFKIQLLVGSLYFSQIREGAIKGENRLSRVSLKRCAFSVQLIA